MRFGNRSRVPFVCCSLAMALTTGAAFSQSFPSKPITIVVPYAPGASADALARSLGEQLGKRLGQTVIVDNKPGAGTLIGSAAVARAAPDGYTLLLAASALTIQPAVNKTFTLDVERDLAPITEAVRGMFLVAATASFPPKTIGEMVDYSKKRPDSVAYGTPGLGTTPHLAGEYLKARTGGNFLHVPYKGSAPALQATLGGQVQFTIDPVFNLKPQVDSGKLKALAVTGATRSPVMPDVPTVAESGAPGFEVNFWIGFFAPAGTPKPIVARISKEFAAILHAPETMQRLQAQGFDVVGGTPEEFAGRIKSELLLWKKLVQDQNLKFD